MDDVFGELDPYRRKALLACLPTNTQKILTTTHLDWTDSGVEVGLCLEVESGGLREVGKGG